MAYVNARVVSNELQVDGRVLIVLAVVGDAGEEGVQLKYYVPSKPSLAALRNTIADKVDELNFIKTVAAAPAVQPGQIITPLARVAPTPTAKQVWREKYGRYTQIKDAGITAATAEVTALKDDLEATYQAGFLD